MKRRSFLSAIAAFFALKPTTTLVAAGLECSTVAAVKSSLDAATIAIFQKRFVYAARLHSELLGEYRVDLGFIEGDRW